MNIKVKDLNDGMNLGQELANMTNKTIILSQILNDDMRVISHVLTTLENESSDSMRHSIYYAKA